MYYDPKSSARQTVLYSTIMYSCFVRSYISDVPGATLPWTDDRYDQCIIVTLLYLRSLRCADSDMDSGQMGVITVKVFG